MFLSHKIIPFFFLPKIIFCLFHCKTRWIMSMSDVGLQICLMGPWSPWSLWHVFPWCKPKWSKTSSIASHTFYKALQLLQVHGVNNPNIFEFLVYTTWRKWCTRNAMFVLQKKRQLTNEIRVGNKRNGCMID